jgi:hypothetical protein
MPEDAMKGLIDYRCIYFWNPAVSNAVTDTKVAIAQCEACIPSGVLFHGSRLQNDIQKIEINCEPDEGGYAIFVTEFGPPFTVYWKGDWSEFAADMQSRINELPWCPEVTVSLEGDGVLIVEFMGEVGNRNVCLMRVVQNSLLHMGSSRYNTETYFSCDGYNSFGSSMIRTVQPISDSVPQSGKLYVYNPLNGAWAGLSYNMHTAFEFMLDDSLEFNMVGFKGSCSPKGSLDYPQNWQRQYPSPAYYGDGHNLPLPVPWGMIEVPGGDDKPCQICIGKKAQGYPINTIADEIATDIDAPMSVDFSQETIPVGNLRPNEGFYWWIKRETPSASPPCLEHFVNLKVNAMKVSWPLMGDS